MNPQRTDADISRQQGEARQALDDLTAQGADAQARLSELQSQYHRVSLAMAAAIDTNQSATASRLLEANQNLVCSSLRAQEAADACALELKAMARSAQRDPLTGLPNRELLLDRLAHAIAVARSGGGKLALLFVDMNHFKSINDAMGHAVGDQVLRQAAACLLSAVREGDTVSRQGGDEFLILLDVVSQPSDAMRVAHKVVSALSMPCRIGDHVVRLSASIGICLYPDDGDTPQLLIDRADAAMYRAKRSGTDAFVFHGQAAEALAPLVPAALAALKPPVVPIEVAAAEHERRVAQLREANEQLVLAALDAQDLQAAAEAAQRRLKEFLAVVAHELRNPLTPLGVAASMLCGSDAADLARMQHIIEDQVDKMNRLVGDLLDLSRANTGKLRLDLRNVDLAKCFEDAVNAARPAMDTRLQHFDVQLPTQPVTLRADPVRLAQILCNLLDNASKYTPVGGDIHLSASLGTDSVLIRVADNGIGVSASALATVFDLFAQDTHATGFNAQGLGIGLTVVKELAESHGGHVTVTSPGVGLGSEFVVTLPLRPPGSPEEGT